MTFFLRKKYLNTDATNQNFKMSGKSSNSRQLEKQMVVARVKPYTWKKMQPAEVSGTKLDAMRNILQRKLQMPKSKHQNTNEELLQLLDYLPLADEKNNSKYHTVYKYNKKFLVNDKTLKEMELIVNSGIKHSRSDRFMNQSILGDYANTEFLPVTSFDQIIEQIDDLEDELEVSPASSQCSLSSVSSEWITSVKPLSLITTESEEELPTTITSKKSDFENNITLVPDAMPIEFSVKQSESPVQSLTPYDEDIQKRRINFRIFGDFVDGIPKFKIEKWKQDIDELTANIEERNRASVKRKLNSKYTGNKARISISAQLFKKPEGFSNISQDLTECEPIDKFTIKDIIPHYNNNTVELLFSVSGKLVNKTQNEVVLPKLSIQIGTEVFNSVNIEKPKQMFHFDLNKELKRESGDENLWNNGFLQEPELINKMVKNVVD